MWSFSFLDLHILDLEHFKVSAGLIIACSPFIRETRLTGKAQILRKYFLCDVNRLRLFKAWRCCFPQSCLAKHTLPEGFCLQCIVRGQCLQCNNVNTLIENRGKLYHPVHKFVQLVLATPHGFAINKLKWREISYIKSIIRTAKAKKTRKQYRYVVFKRLYFLKKKISRHKSRINQDCLTRKDT